MAEASATSHPSASDETGPIEQSVGQSERSWQLPMWLRADAPFWIWLGVVVAGMGFGLIAITWGRVAAETQVYLQLPYVVSGGLTGLGLVLVGLTVLNVVSRHRDAIDRNRQISQLIDIMAELKETLADHRSDPEPRRGRSTRRRSRPEDSAQ